jgi:hypothetical protein
MTTSFVTGTPPAANFQPWSHVPNVIPLTQGVTTAAAKKVSNKAAIKAAAQIQKQPTPAAVQVLKAAWLQKKQQIFAGKLNKPDAEDPDTVNHLNWYETTGFVRPYPGETKVRPPSDFKNPAPIGDLDD